MIDSDLIHIRMTTVAIHEILPFETIEYILSLCDPLDVAAFAQTSSFFRSLVYETADQHLWRRLYLAQPYDDPRNCISHLGNPCEYVNWKSELQRIIRARTVLEDITVCRPEERTAVIETLLNMIDHVLPATHAFSEGLSENLLWVAAILRGGAFLHHEEWTLTAQERQLRARLHVHFGITPEDVKPLARVKSRAFVYDMRNYKWENHFGPFLMDGSGCVNWEHMQALHHVLSMHIVDIREDDDFMFTIFPLSMPFCQPIIPKGINLNLEEDWARVTGVWTCTYCFCDHRELISELDSIFMFHQLSHFSVYNDFNVGSLA